MEIATFINSTNLRQRKLINMKNTSAVLELMHVDNNQNGDSLPFDFLSWRKAKIFFAAALHMFFSVWSDPDTNTGTRMFG